ncbi:hypothetical protein LINGRAHAP2_LOCUS23196, partial [Linum grandiflorum]
AAAILSRRRRRRRKSEQQQQQQQQPTSEGGAAMGLAGTKRRKKNEEKEEEGSEKRVNEAHAGVEFDERERVELRSLVRGPWAGLKAENGEEKVPTASGVESGQRCHQNRTSKLIGGRRKTSPEYGFACRRSRRSWRLKKVDQSAKLETSVTNFQFSKDK